MKSMKPADLRTNIFTVVTLILVIVATVLPMLTPGQKVGIYIACVVYMLLNLITAFVARPKADASAPQPAPAPAPVSSGNNTQLQASLYSLLQRWQGLLQQAEAESVQKQSEGRGTAYIRGVAYGLQVAVRDVSRTLGIPEESQPPTQEQ